jgi:hypothetical protein
MWCGYRVSRARRPLSGTTRATVRRHGGRRARFVVTVSPSEPMGSLFVFVTLILVVRRSFGVTRFEDFRHAPPDIIGRHWLLRIVTGLPERYDLLGAEGE